ncbi:hypothetical protein SteCoe_7777 [Stentor coeruleus]|uniref:Uncharacterized protein n=1 Tax=Stentor coeruleus TaxID=5963 RepID=A0A1R2CLU3_9CILI|nr:hypothetical protein SteCoe_7777 [Stentor coeruleus]
MNLASFFFIVTIASKAFATSCTNSNASNLTFYILSSTNDILTCSTRSPVNAVLSPYLISKFPDLISIWDSPKDTNIYHCLMTKYFFVPGRLINAVLDGFADDTMTIIINEFQVSEFSNTEICKLQLNKNVSRYIKSGLNKLFIDAYNGGGKGYFGYRLTINILLD